jgi:hypothetical protein
VAWAEKASHAEPDPVDGSGGDEEGWAEAAGDGESWVSPANGDAEGRTCECGGVAASWCSAGELGSGRSARSPADAKPEAA